MYTQFKVFLQSLLFVLSVVVLDPLITEEPGILGGAACSDIVLCRDLNRFLFICRCTYGLHTCSGLFDEIHPKAPARFLVQQFIGKLRDQLSYPSFRHAKDVNRDRHINICTSDFGKQKNMPTRLSMERIKNHLNCFLITVNKSMNEILTVRHSWN